MSSLPIRRLGVSSGNRSSLVACVVFMALGFVDLAVARQDESGGPGIWVVGVDGSPATLIEPPRTMEPTSPRWSPDGARIAFVGADETTRENSSDVFSIRVDGADRVNLTTAIAEQVIDLAWAPDGTRLAVLCLVPGGTIRVYAVNADGSNPILVAEQRPASPVYVAWSGLVWSPTGERLAFVAAGESGNDLIVVGADGNGLINLTDDQALNIDPAWSPDGAQLAFVSGSRTRSHLEVIVADGTARRQLTATTGSNRRPSWSPDGSRIAVAVYPSHEDDANAGIYSIRADGADVIRITEDGDDPQWSPDGAQIAFVSAGVNVVAADGSSRTRITRTDLFESDPQWSPDGALIAFSRHGPWD